MFEESQHLREMTEMQPFDIDTLIEEFNDIGIDHQQEKSVKYLIPHPPTSEKSPVQVLERDFYVTHFEFFICF
jgi:hypothetical protein